MRANRGFTLIELMIAVIIVGILTAIAIPSYYRYVVNANQSAAQQAMLDLASRLEEYRIDARDYPTNGIGTGAGQIEFDAPDDVDTNYDISMTATTGPSTYTITADPQSGTVVAGTSKLTLDSAGNKKPADAW